MERQIRDTLQQYIKGKLECRIYSLEDGITVIEVERSNPFVEQFLEERSVFQETGYLSKSAPRAKMTVHQPFRFAFGLPKEHKVDDASFIAGMLYGAIIDKKVLITETF